MSRLNASLLDALVMTRPLAEVYAFAIRIADFTQGPALIAATAATVGPKRRARVAK